MSFKYIYFLWVFLFLLIFIPAVHGADDLTLIGNVNPVYSLKDAVSQSVTTSRKEVARLEVNDAVIMADQIMIRFIVYDLPVSFSLNVTDESRLYGEYLPVAEIGTPNGSWLTPSSRSHFSLLSNGDALVVAGLLVFPTVECPQIISFNFNQIPFDKQPLSEGAVFQLEFSEGDTLRRSDSVEHGMKKDGVQFSLQNTAQTPNFTMIQPAAAPLREDESLSQFGWITIHEKNSGHQYAVTRGSIYGFNIADDHALSPAHAYIFSPITQEEPLLIEMDYAYIKREVKGAFTLKAGGLLYSWQDDELSFHVTDFQIFEREEEGHPYNALRLNIEASNAVSYIDFNIPDSLYQEQPAVCGFVDNQFACELTIEDGLIEQEPEIQFSGIEYRVNGPWQAEWTPLKSTDTLMAENTEIIIQDSADEQAFFDEFPEKVRQQQLALSAELSSKPGWVLERTLVHTAEDSDKLISHNMVDRELNEYIQETWCHVREDGTVNETLLIQRDPADERLITGTWTGNGIQLILPQGLRYAGNKYSGWAVPFTYDSEFRSLADTSAVFAGEEKCEFENETYTCAHFYHALISPTDPNRHDYFFWINDNGQIIHTETFCGLNESSPCIEKTLRELSFYPNLSNELQSLLENIIL